MTSPFPPLAELVPHKPPMLLLDEVVAVGDTSLTARVTLTEASMFVEHGRAPALVAIEYMAQAIAAWAGAARRDKNEPPRLGFLLSCREMTLEVDELSVGDELLVTIERVWSDEQLGSFDCSVARGGARIAQAALSVYQGELPAAGAP